VLDDFQKTTQPVTNDHVENRAKKETFFTEHVNNSTESTFDGCFVIRYKISNSKITLLVQLDLSQEITVE